jgi:hypothetical protein
MDLTAITSAAASSVSFDLVHVELSLQEIVDLARQGISLFREGFELVRGAFCSLPFVTSC